MLKRVLTLNNRLFADACATLQMCAEEFNPDLLVCIATGGVEVGKMMFDGVPHVNVTLQRPTTKGKKRCRLLHTLVGVLPYFALDLLRNIEDVMLHMRKRVVCLAPVSIPEPTLAAIKSARRILIVDDSIDSGVTAASVANAVKDANRQADVRLAVITLTHQTSAVAPDYVLYQNILIRFPWSIDNKHRC